MTEPHDVPALVDRMIAEHFERSRRGLLASALALVFGLSGAGWAVSTYLFVPSIRATEVHSALRHEMSGIRTGVAVGSGRIDTLESSHARTTKMLDELRHNVYAIGRQVGARGLRQE